MIRGKNIDRFCIAAVCLALLIAAGMIVGCYFFAEPAAEKPKGVDHLSDAYADILFDDSFVHEIDIRLPEVNWDYMVRFAEDEQYVLCNVVIDGELVENAAIRPKGNSSLSAIKAIGSDRFSFKIEFDHYRSGTTYHGLDKLSLNNLGQDVSCMKDYLSYRMMNEIGISAPLCSYAMVKLNGEDFGLYLAVEAIEDSFALRNYGDDFGNLYKPECFAMENVTPSAFLDTEGTIFQQDFTTLGPGDRVDILGTAIRGPFEKAFGENMEVAALHYVGDDPERYKVFFDSAVFDLKQSDRDSLIRALKTLNSDPASAVDYDSVIPYFIVHNFVNNYDGYTGIFVHNYYLREADGKLSMIPWDYNLGFGIFTFESAVTSFMGEESGYTVDLAVGNAMDDRTAMVNYPIDTPTFTVSVADRPLLAAVLQDEANLQRYHREYEAFLDDFFASGRFDRMYRSAWENIAPYVAAGQTFYSYDRFVTASEAIHDYCILREESIRRQLAGSLPATMEGQREDYAGLVDASGVNLASSVTFDSLVFGIRSEDIIEIFDAIAGDHPHNSEGVTAAFAEAAEDTGRIMPMLGRVAISSSLLKRAVGSVLKAPVLLILAIAVLVRSRKWVMGYRRRRR